MTQFNSSPQIFISYSRKDIVFARRLVDRFESREIKAWIDWIGIPPSVEWWQEIEDAIEKSDIFIFLISPDSLASGTCKKEIAHCLSNGKRIIPIVVRDPDTDVQGDLAKLNWIFFRKTDDFEAAFESLLEALFTDFKWVKAHSRIQGKALEWKRHRGDKSYLLRGRELREADRLLKAKADSDPQPTDLQLLYLRKSKQAIRTLQWIPFNIVLILSLVVFFWGKYYFYILPVQSACPAVSRVEIKLTEAKQLSESSKSQLLEAISKSESITPSSDCKSGPTETIEVSVSPSSQTETITIKVTLPSSPAYKLDFLPEIRSFDPETVRINEAKALIQASYAYSLGEYDRVETLLRNYTSLTSLTLLSQSYLFLDKLEKSQSTYDQAIKISKDGTSIIQMLRMGAALAWWRPLINDSSAHKKNEFCYKAGEYYNRLKPWAGGESLVFNTRILFAHPFYCNDTAWQSKAPVLDPLSPQATEIAQFILALRCIHENETGMTCDPVHPLDASKNIIKARSLLAQEYLFRKHDCQKAQAAINGFQNDIINKSDLMELKTLLRYQANECP